eukprot:11997453-Alexandrium_andersonii.AAC.1
MPSWAIASLGRAASSCRPSSRVGTWPHPAWQGRAERSSPSCGSCAAAPSSPVARRRRASRARAQ